MSGVDQEKLVKHMKLNSNSVDKESLSRYYAYHKLKSKLTKSQSNLQRPKVMDLTPFKGK